MQHVCTFPDCKSTFQRPSKLQIHLRKHTGERPYVCNEEFCGKSYTNDSHLRRHKLQTHQRNQKDKNKTYKCTVDGCEQEFVSLQNMNKHRINIHRKDYICVICNEGFHKKYKLRAHMVIHTGDVNIKCELCLTNYKNRTEYMNHKRHHKSYTCSCGEIFYRWTVYCRHRRTEHITKHTCNTCGKEFAMKISLRRHLLTHSNERTVFVCPFKNCERLYYYKNNLQHHVAVFHMNIKKPLPPSKQILKNSQRIKKPQKTLETGRNPRKDKKSFKQSTALKLVGLTVPLEAEKKLIEGKPIKIEDSDQFIDTSDYSDRTK